MTSNTITAGKFSFSEFGFLCDLEPRCTQSGILKRLLTPDQVSLKWLKAQLAHYSLKLSGNKDELEARLKRAIAEGKVKSQPKELKEMEKGLKTAFEARGGGASKSKGKVEKKKVSAAKGRENASSSSLAAVKKETTAKAPTKKKTDAALHAAIAAATRKSSTVAVTSPKPRVSFADNLLGTYTVTCGTFPYSSSSLTLYRHSLEPKLTGSLDLGSGAIYAMCTLDWLPMAKQSRVPFSATHGRRGEMEFSAGKGGVKMKGKMEGCGQWGMVEFLGVKVGGEEGEELLVEDGFMDVAW